MKHSPSQQDDLVFVNISRPDEIKSASTQRTIRRRVMRDIGKSRRTQRRPQTLALSLRPSPGPDPVTSGSPSMDTSIPTSLDPCNTTFYPTQLDERGLQLMHFMTSDRDYVFRPFRSVWFSMALTDPSAIFVALANAAMFFDQRTREREFRYETSAECLAYYGQCVQQVRGRLQDVNESLSEGVITAILGLICHDLRGGYHGLNANVTLFAFWLDVVGSVAEDNRPRMPKPMVDAEYLWTDSPNVLTHLARSLLDEISMRRGTFSDVVIAFNYVTSIATTVHESQCSPDPFWRQEDNITMINMFGPATHFLLSMSRPTDIASSAQGVILLREATRLALLILLAALKRDVFLFTSSEWPHLQHKFATLVPFLPIPEYDAPCLKLCLWAIATVSLLSNAGYPGPYTAEIRAVMDRLGIDSIDTLKTVKSILWVDALHIQTEPFITGLSVPTCT
ncbi:uncharacterized protein BO97DRAFT_442815 [Aspergillus homomorphus CBS 101889]|uniref:Uncharacterized protein n=1 Tax=Aspergillus homomorphus (strain CBS 101889) TaxID=1450537 RepID=A0A395HZW1_ASPHC|nr:hypothetical protein BO97DRAFT_442815 [Aspergillus homomorphus CBS 101889]RAL12969.1 hypothetical protein BO97DRAFT_442815 [Aspergillus homomorphus CBS 101889]